MTEQLKWALKVFDNHPDPMVVSRIRDGSIERVNAAFLSMFGYNQTEVIGKSSLDLFMIEQADRQKSIALLKKQGYIRDIKVNIQTKDDEIRSASLTAIEIEDDDEPRMLTFIHDITELKRIKERLEYNQEIIQHLIDNIPLLLTIWDPRLQRFTINRHSESVLGWTTADANDPDIMSKVFPDPVYRSEIAAFMLSLSSEWREQNMVAKDGSIIPTTWTNTSLSDETMIGIGLDLRERNRLLNALRESENNFRVALANSNFVPAQFDRDQRYRWIYNPHPDFDPAFVIGKRDDELDNSQSAKRLRALKQQVIESGKSMHETIPFDRSDGTYWYDFIIEPIRDAGGKITGGTSTAYDITRQKLAELSLRESEERFRTMADGLPLIVWVHDGEGRQQFVNRTFLEFFGVTEEEVKNRRWQLLIHPDDAAAYTVEFEACVHHRRPFHAIARVWHATSEWRWIESWGRPRFSSSGEFLGYVGTSADITERKQAEEELRKSEYKHRLLAEEAPVSIMHFDKTGIVTFVNKWHVDVFAKGKLDRDFFLNKKITDLPGIQAAGMGSELKKILNGEKVILDQVHIPKFAAGHEGYQAIKGIPLFHGAEVIGGVLIREDITVRKQAEDALRKSEARYRALVTSSSEVLYRMSPDWSEVHQLHSREFLADSSTANRNWFNDYIPPEDQPRVNAVIDEAVRTRNIFEMEHRVRQADGSIGWTFSRAVPLFDEYGEIIEWFGAASNITERKQAEKLLQELNATLERRVIERTQLAESRATQLQALAVELVDTEERVRTDIAEFLHEDLQQIIASARMQLQVLFEKGTPITILENVDRMLEESIEKSRRLAHELSPPVLYQFGLSAGLKWLVRHMDEQFGMKVQLKEELTHQVKDKSFQIFLFRAAQELLFNSFKHSGVKNANVCLSINDYKLVLSVCDRGKGFYPDLLDTPDKRFGLGLISLRERTRALGGEMEIKTGPGKGSQVSLRIPLNLPEIDDSTIFVPEAEYRPESSHQKKAASSLKNIRVLLVDDHKVMRQGLVSMISAQPGVQVAGEAGSGEEALALARQLSPDVILMDISMPGMDGVEATRLIKVENPEIRVIGLSMFADEGIAKKMSEAGADGFVSKSQSSSELLKAIDKVVG